MTRMIAMDDLSLANVLEYATDGYFFFARVCKRWRKLLRLVNPEGLTLACSVISLEQNQEFARAHADWIPYMLEWGVRNDDVKVVEYAATLGSRKTETVYTLACARKPVNLDMLKMLKKVKASRPTSSVMYLHYRIAMEDDVPKLAAVRKLLGGNCYLNEVGRGAARADARSVLTWLEKQLKIKRKCSEEVEKIRDEARWQTVNTALETGNRALADWLLERGFVLDRESLLSALIGGHLDLASLLARKYMYASGPRNLTLSRVLKECKEDTWRASVDWLLEKKPRGWRYAFEGACQGRTVDALQYLVERDLLPARMIPAESVRNLLERVLETAHLFTDDQVIAKLDWLYNLSMISTSEHDVVAEVDYVGAFELKRLALIRHVHSLWPPPRDSSLGIEFATPAIYDYLRAEQGFRLTEERMRIIKCTNKRLYSYIIHKSQIKHD